MKSYPEQKSKCLRLTKSYLRKKQYIDCAFNVFLYLWNLIVKQNKNSQRTAYESCLFWLFERCKSETFLWIYSKHGAIVPGYKGKPFCPRKKQKTLTSFGDLIKTSFLQKNSEKYPFSARVKSDHHPNRHTELKNYVTWATCGIIITLSRELNMLKMTRINIWWLPFLGESGLIRS